MLPDLTVYGQFAELLFANNTRLSAVLSSQSANTFSTQNIFGIQSAKVLY